MKGRKIMDNEKNWDRKGTENERRIDHLANLVEKQTRTERHLEQTVAIPSSPENIAHAKQIQQDRQDEIDTLKNKIVHGENTSNNYRENTEKRLVFTEGYLNHNADHMNPEDIKNAERKQEHRKEQLDSLK
jgi:hypothetical protein